MYSLSTTEWTTRILIWDYYFVIMSRAYTTLALDNSENDKSTGTLWHKNIFIASRNLSSFDVCTCPPPPSLSLSSLFERYFEIDFNLSYERPLKKFSEKWYYADRYFNDYANNIVNILHLCLYVITYVCKIRSSSCVYNAKGHLQTREKRGCATSLF